MSDRDNLPAADETRANAGGMRLANEHRIGNPIYGHTRDRDFTYPFRDREYASGSTVEVRDPVQYTPHAAHSRMLPGPARIQIMPARSAGAPHILSTWAFPWADSIVTNQEATVGNP
jgi:hypothetical protein